MHIVSIIVFYTAVLLLIWAFVHGAEKLERARKARLKCMMYHPAGKLAPIEHSRVGVTEENFQPWHLEGD